MPMPIYEYQCAVCGRRFAHFWRSMQAADQNPSPDCPQCQSPETQRVLSQVAVLGSLGGMTPTEQRRQEAQQQRLASITSKEQIDKLRTTKKKD
ncbi:MAG: zinc ribbon domain-containing protein [Chloroflexi bacterium]|nr:zinc ribbon domain-containing protein [Chloroflexota bacterium]